MGGGGRYRDAGGAEWRLSIRKPELGYLFCFCTSVLPLLPQASRATDEECPPIPTPRCRSCTAREGKSRRGRARGECTAPQTRGVGPDSSIAPSIFPGPGSAPEGVLPAGNCGPGSPPAPGWTGSAASRKLQVPGCPARVGHEGAAAGAAK